MKDQIIEWNGLSFPVVLRGFKKRTVRGVEVPDVNMKEIQKQAFYALIVWEHRFTGQHVRFIRSYLQEKQSELAKAINVSHGLVSQWEDKGNRFTKMDINTELILRYHMLHAIQSPNFRSHADVDLVWQRTLGKLLDILGSASERLKSDPEPITLVKDA